MRPERAVTGVLIKAATIIIVSFLFYAVAVSMKEPVPQPVGRQGVVQRALELLRRTFHIKSPYMSEGDLREKAQRYIK